jgi:hypothetical protein
MRLVDVKETLRTLCTTSDASFHTEKACLPGTRVRVLQTIRDWYLEESTSQVLLVIGQAGLGKSAIAHSVAQELMLLRRLGAFFGFSKVRGHENFFRTIARDLTDLDSNYAAELARQVSNNTRLATTTSVYDQFSELLSVPLSAGHLRGPIVIVVDALDECPNERQAIIQCLTDRVRFKLPSNIRFLVTSRPSEAGNLYTSPMVKSLNLAEESEDNTREDILSFVSHRLMNPGDMTRCLLPREHLESLAKASEGLFQYAAVVSTEILAAYNVRKSPTQAFYRLTKGRHGLDSLYSHILENAWGIKRSSLLPDATIKNFHRVMGMILVAQTHLTRGALLDFGKILSQSPAEAESLEDNVQDATEEGYDVISFILHPLGALLSGIYNTESAAVYPLHSSFRDYLLDSSRSEIFCIGEEKSHHILLGVLCLRLMEQQLHFNMAGLESSYFYNHQVPDFDVKVKNGISQSLSYSCRHWVQHLLESNISAEELNSTIYSTILVMLSTSFLFWVEALALEKKTIASERGVKHIQAWLKEKVSFDTIIDIVTDKI